MTVYPTPGRNVDGNDSIDAILTPETPYGITWYPNPTKRVRKMFKKCIMEIPENEHDRRMKRQKENKEWVTEINRKMIENIKLCLGPDGDSSGSEDVEEEEQKKDEHCLQRELRDYALNIYIAQLFVKSGVSARSGCYIRRLILVAV